VISSSGHSCRDRAGARTAALGLGGKPPFDHESSMAWRRICSPATSPADRANIAKLPGLLRL
jgi:hypothetical protein